MAIDLHSEKEKKAPKVEVFVPKSKPIPQAQKPAKVEPVDHVKFQEEEDEEIEDKDFETPSERMESRRFITTMSEQHISKKVFNTDFQEGANRNGLKPDLQSFRPIIECKNEDGTKAKTIEQPYQLDVRASCGTAANKPLIVSGNKSPSNTGRKVSVMS